MCHTQKADVAVKHQIRPARNQDTLLTCLYNRILKEPGGFSCTSPFGKEQQHFLSLSLLTETFMHAQDLKITGLPIVGVSENY